MKKLAFLMIFALSLPFVSSQIVESSQSFEEGKSQKYVAGVKKINDYLYIGKKEDGLYFVMERIDEAVPNSESRLQFWRNYVKSENSGHGNYKKAWSQRDGNLPRGFLLFPGRAGRLDDGLYSFEESLNKYYTNNELWVAYVSTLEPKKADDIQADNIEMAVSIMTNPEAPMVVHMGISRSFNYLLNALDEVEKETQKRKFPLHKDLAMGLHSFAAKVMLLRDPQKIYMVTSPVPMMRDIMTKAISKDHAFVGNGRTEAERIYEAQEKSEDVKELSKLIDEEMEEIKKAEEEFQIKKIDPMEEDYKKITDIEEQKKVSEEIDKLYKEKQELKKEMKSELVGPLWKERSEIISKKYDQILEKLKKEGKLPPLLCGDWRCNKVEILDKKRKDIVYSDNRDEKIVTVNNQTFKDDETKRFDWFHHRDLSFNPYITIDYDALASYMKLQDSSKFMD